SFLFSEDPYVRLWKVWVEKFYLTDFWFKSFDDPKVLTAICKPHVTFPEFLSTIASKKYLDNPASLNTYWRPQSKLCDICSLSPTFVGKMETFEEDTRCILKMTNYTWAVIPEDKRGLNHLSTLALSMAPFKHRPSALRGMRTLAQENFARWTSDPLVRDCITLTDLVKRLWSAFQSLGYLPTRTAVPPYLLGKTIEEINVEMILVECVLAMRHWPGSTARAKQYLRENEFRNTVAKAYTNVGTELLAKLQALYSEDFQTLDYKPQPLDMYFERYLSDDS
ncbi:hypothetical protein EGW08_016198, partial [Elysia chlorotica]